MSPNSKAWFGVALAAAIGASAWWLLPARQGAVASDVIPVAAAPAAVNGARLPPAVEPAGSSPDPWAFADAVAASAPAVSKTRCGMDEAPGYAEPDGPGTASMPLDPRPPGPHFLQFEQAIDSTLRSSADPYDHVVADWLNAGDARSPGERLDAVVQAATTTTDPRVYALAYGSCSGQREAGGSCRLLNARQWAALDAGNGVPWMYVFGDAVAADDASGQQEALAHLAASARFDVATQAPVGEVAAAAPADDDALAAANDLVVRALLQAVTPAVPYNALMTVCRRRAGGDANLAQQCAAIGDVMFDHSDSLMGRAIGAALTFQESGDPSRRELARAERIAYEAHWSPATGFSACQDMRESLKRVRRTAQVGELEAARERARSFVPP